MSALIDLTAKSFVELQYAKLDAASDNGQPIGDIMELLTDELHAHPRAEQIIRHAYEILIERVANMNSEQIADAMWAARALEAVELEISPQPPGARSEDQPDAAPAGPP